MPRKLTRQEAHEFIDSKPGWIMLTTIGPDGYPHTVPLEYFRLGDEILMGVRSDTRKQRNIQENPKVSLLLESGRTLKDIKGIMIQGNGHFAYRSRRNPELCPRCSEAYPSPSFLRSREKTQSISEWCRSASARGIIRQTPNRGWAKT